MKPPRPFGPPPDDEKASLRDDENDDDGTYVWYGCKGIYMRMRMMMMMICAVMVVHMYGMDVKGYI